MGVFENEILREIW